MFLHTKYEEAFRNNTKRHDTTSHQHIKPFMVSMFCSQRGSHISPISFKYTHFPKNGMGLTHNCSNHIHNTFSNKRYHVNSRKHVKYMHIMLIFWLGVSSRKHIYWTIVLFKLSYCTSNDQEIV